MTDVILLRLDAPWMSFGGVITDNNGVGVTDRHPGLSMLTGLLGNALGWHHRDAARLDALQSDLRIASRIDRSGTPDVDYQTVDLGQSHLLSTAASKSVAWTTWGQPEVRAGSQATKTGTHIRRRAYHADRIVTVALTLMAEKVVTMNELETALHRPARPLFLGRKPCIPSAPLLLERRDAPTLLHALRDAQVASRLANPPERMPASWPADEPDAPEGSPVTRHDVRSWRNNAHLGQRETVEGLIEVRHV